MPFDSYANLQTTVLDWLARPNDPLVAPAVPDMIALFEEEARDRLQTRFVEQTVDLMFTPGSGIIPLPLDFGQARGLWITTAFGRQHFQYQTPRNLDTNFGTYFLSQHPVAYTIQGLHLRFVGFQAAPPPGSPPVPGTGPGQVTLTPGAATTIYQDVSIVATTFVGLMPETANAADALPSVWVVPGSGMAVIHHASSPNADQIFTVSLFNTGDPGQLSGAGAGVVHLDYFSGIPPLSNDAPTNWLLTEYPSAYLWGTLVCAAPYIGDDPRLPMWLGARESAIERIRLADRRAKFPLGLMIQTDVRNP